MAGNTFSREELDRHLQNIEDYWNPANEFDGQESLKRYLERLFAAVPQTSGPRMIPREFFLKLSYSRVLELFSTALAPTFSSDEAREEVNLFFLELGATGTQSEESTLTVSPQRFEKAFENNFNEELFSDDILEKLLETKEQILQEAELVKIDPSAPTQELTPSVLIADDFANELEYYSLELLRSDKEARAAILRYARDLIALSQSGEFDELDEMLLDVSDWINEDGRLELFQDEEDFAEVILYDLENATQFLGELLIPLQGEGYYPRLDLGRVSQDQIPPFSPDFPQVTLGPLRYAITPIRRNG